MSISVQFDAIPAAPLFRNPERALPQVKVHLPARALAQTVSPRRSRRGEDGSNRHLSPKKCAIICNDFIMNDLQIIPLCQVKACQSRSNDLLPKDGPEIRFMFALRGDRSGCLPRRLPVQLVNARRSQ